MAAHRGVARAQAALTRRAEVGKARIQAARDHLQRALVELGYARLDLAGVHGVSLDIRDLDRLVAAGKRLFYAMGMRSDTKGKPINAHGDLDHEPSKDEIANPHNGGCGQRNWKASY